MANEKMTGAEELRAIVRVLDQCNESFLDRFSVAELIKLYRALKRSEWDILPDRWTSKEIESALNGEGRGAEGETVCTECRDARPTEGHNVCTTCAWREMQV